MSDQRCALCGHAAHNGPCAYEYWDDGTWFEGFCGCEGKE